MEDGRGKSATTTATPIAAAPRREHFIPIRPDDLIERIVAWANFDDGELPKFRSLCQLLIATLHFEYHKRLRSLKKLYAPFDPDADTAPTTPNPKAETVLSDELFKEFGDLMERGNFYRVSTEVLQSATRMASKGGLDLDIDFDSFERLDVFARGEGTVERKIRKLGGVAGNQKLDVPVYRRLVVIFRLKRADRTHGYASSSHIHMKIFKDIPKPDVEMLLPGTRFRMTLADRGKIWLPTVSGIAMTIYKLVEGALTVAVAGVYGLLGVLGLAGGTIGYGVKSYLGYLETQRKYQLALTQSLYFLNLDNNAGVFCRLLDEAEEQEFREALLSYVFLLQQGGAEGVDLKQMDASIETWLREQCKVDVDFEEGDAIDKLIRYKLVEQIEPGRFRAVALSTALERLDFAWDNTFRFNHTLVLGEP